MDEGVAAYVAGIPAAHRALFDRLDALIREVAPDARVGISYRIPTYRVGRRRLYVGAWRHGVSLYGWRDGADGGFAAAHPELLSGRATLRLRPADAETITDDELRALVRTTLGGD